MNMARNRIVSLALVACLLLTMTLVLPGTVAVQAADVKMQENKPTITRNITEIAFAGHEWVVIGYNGNGVYSSNNTATLLLKNSDAGGGFDPVPFREGYGSEPDGDFAQHTNNWWYANNPSGNHWSAPNEYRGSTLQREMEIIADVFPDKERTLINARTLTASDDTNNPITGGDVLSQRLWPLSHDEGDTISTNVRAYVAHWWLRSPISYDDMCAGVVLKSGSNRSDSNVDSSWAVRPAFQLNLESVIFTSDASETSGKSVAAVGSGLVGASAPTGILKFTMRDNSIAKPTLTFAGTTKDTDVLRFGYTGATTGGNQYISCVLVDGNNDVAYYGKLADCDTDSSGVFSIPLNGVADDTYTLKIFCEQANGDLHTDFAGASDDYTLVVNGSGGSVSGGSGTTDNDPPEVDSVVPANGGVDIPVSDEIAITFNEEMNTASGVGQVALDYDVGTLSGGNWSNNKKTFTVPYTGLAYGTTYTITISGFYDAAGNEMDAVTSDYSFTTEEEPVIPSVTVSPDEVTLTVGVPDNADIIATATATNFGGAVTFSIDSPPDLPAGLEIDANNGEIYVDDADALEVTAATTVKIVATDGTDTDTADLIITVVDGGGSPGPGQQEGPGVSDTLLEINTSETETFTVSLGQSGNMAARADISSNRTDVATATPDSLTTDGPVEVKGIMQGSATITVEFSGGDLATPTQIPITVQVRDPDEGGGTDPTDPTVPGGNGGGASTAGSASRSRSSSGGGSNVRTEPKTTLSALAFSWDGGRTLTIDHDSITPLGLLSVQWDGITLTRGADYGVYQGSVIVRFDHDFIGAQNSGDHRVRVEFLNHYGETTVTVGEGITNTDDGPYDDAFVDGTYNPNTGDESRSLILLALLGCLGGLALAVWCRRKRV